MYTFFLPHECFVWDICPQSADDYGPHVLQRLGDVRWLWRRVRWGQRKRRRAAPDVTYWRGRLFLKGTAIHQGLTSFPNADDSGADDEGSLIMLLARLIKPSQVSGRAPAALQGEGRGGTGLGSRRASASSQLRPWVRPGVLAWTRRTRRGAQGPGSGPGPRLAANVPLARDASHASPAPTSQPRHASWRPCHIRVMRPRRPRHSRVTGPRSPRHIHVTCPRRPRHIRVTRPWRPCHVPPASASRVPVSVSHLRHASRHPCHIRVTSPRHPRHQTISVRVLASAPRSSVTIAF